MKRTKTHGSRERLSAAQENGFSDSRSQLAKNVAQGSPQHCRRHRRPITKEVQGCTTHYLSRPRAAFRAAVVTCRLVDADGLPRRRPSALAQRISSRRQLVRKISGANDKLELTTNTSRILTLDKNIPRVQVNNPELLAVTPLSANQVQISAKKAGVTQVNLWDEDGNDPHRRRADLRRRPRTGSRAANAIPARLDQGLPL